MKLSRKVELINLNSISYKLTAYTFTKVSLPLLLFHQLMV